MVLRLRAGTLRRRRSGEKVESAGQRERFTAVLRTRFDNDSSLIQATSADMSLQLRHLSCTNPYAASEDISEVSNIETII